MNTKEKKELQGKIKKLKEKLDSLLSTENPNPGEVLEISQRLDILVVEEQRKRLDQRNKYEKGVMGW